MLKRAIFDFTSPPVSGHECGEGAQEATAPQWRLGPAPVQNVQLFRRKCTCSHMFRAREKTEAPLVACCLNLCGARIGSSVVCCAQNDHVQELRRYAFDHLAIRYGVALAIIVQGSLRHCPEQVAPIHWTWRKSAVPVRSVRKSRPRLAASSCRSGSTWPTRRRRRPLPCRAGAGRKEVPQAGQHPRWARFQDRGALPPTRYGPDVGRSQHRCGLQAKHFAGTWPDAVSQVMSKTGLASCTATLYLCSMTLLKDLALFDDLEAWAKSMQGKQSSTVKSWTKRLSSTFPKGIVDFSNLTCPFFTSSSQLLHMSYCPHGSGMLEKNGVM